MASLNKALLGPYFLGGGGIGGGVPLNYHDILFGKLRSQDFRDGAPGPKKVIDELIDIFSSFTQEIDKLNFNKTVDLVCVFFK